MITIIIPCLNEEKNINLISNNLKLMTGCKHLIVDGGSIDNSKKLYIKKKFKFICTQPSRGLQQLIGAKASKTSWLFFLHADNKITKENICHLKKFILKKNKQKVAYFKITFRKKTFFASFISWWANFRSLVFKIPFGDQGLLISREYYFKLGGHSKLKIMEDIDLITRIPKENRILLPSKLSTSFKKFNKNGVFWQGTIHIICQILFFLNFNNNLIYKVYKSNE